MKTFLQFIEEKKVLGLIEFFNIDGIGKVAAKLDSGNGAYNVLHGEDIQEQGDKVFFKTVNGRTLLLPKVDEISNLYKILVGKDFIQQDLDALIDVSKENIADKNIEADI